MQLNLCRRISLIFQCFISAQACIAGSPVLSTLYNQSKPKSAAILPSNIPYMPKPMLTSVELQKEFSTEYDFIYTRMDSHSEIQVTKGSTFIDDIHKPVCDLILNERITCHLEGKTQNNSIKASMRIQHVDVIEVVDLVGNIIQIVDFPFVKSKTNVIMFSNVPNLGMYYQITLREKRK